MGKRYENNDNINMRFVGVERSTSTCGSSEEGHKPTFVGGIKNS
jgi:predicted secreted protein